MAKKIKRKEVFKLIDSLVSELDAHEKKCRKMIDKLDEFREAHEPGVSGMSNAPRDGTFIDARFKDTKRFVRVRYSGDPKSKYPSYWITSDLTGGFDDSDFDAWRRPWLRF